MCIAMQPPVFFSNSKLFPLTIRSALGEMCDEIARVVNRRKEVEDELKRKQELEAKIEAAKAKVREEEAAKLKQAKMVEEAAAASVVQVIQAGRPNTRSSSARDENPDGKEVL